MRFPYVSDTGVDSGRICQGCCETNRRYEQGILPASILSQLVPPGVSVHRPLEAIQTRLHSRDGFLKHVVACYGAQRLLAG